MIVYTTIATLTRMIHIVGLSSLFGEGDNSNKIDTTPNIITIQNPHLFKPKYPQTIKILYSKTEITKNNNSIFKWEKVLGRTSKVKDIIERIKKDAIVITPIGLFKIKPPIFYTFFGKMWFKNIMINIIGKIAMHDNILKSDRKLTLEDRESLKEHVIEGVNLLHDAAFSKSIIDFCKYHHERLNGEGYPNKTDDIPLVGRLAVFGI